MDVAADQTAILEALQNGQRFLLAPHARPDGDAIGSMLALGMMIEQMGKSAELVSADRVPLLYRSLPCAQAIRITSAVEGSYDAAILLECDGIGRSGLSGLEGTRLINIDHHASGRRFADINWIDCEASAVAEMVFDLADLAGLRLTPAMATCLYAAVLTDTGCFCYGGTDARTFRLASALVRAGADPTGIAQEIYFHNPLSKMQLLGSALGTLRREGRIAWLSGTREDMRRAGAAEEDCEGIVNYAIGLAGVEIAVFLRELADGRVRLSLRSKQAVNVAAIAERFGGGGHPTASGCTLEGPLRLATETILAELSGSLAAAPRPGR
jgi:phosphoesterase RecJ-like protein